MHDKGLTDYTLENIINKMKKLRQRFKKEADKRRKSGSGRRKTWKFYSQLDNIIGHRPNIEPTFSVDTSAPAPSETASGTVSVCLSSCPVAFLSD